MNKEVIAGTLLFMFTTALIAMIIHVSHSGSASVHHSPPTPISPPFPFLDSLIQSAADDDNTNTNTNTNTSISSASSSLRLGGFFVMGDSSVDCGGNTLFYPLLRHYHSLLPCSNSSDSTLIPHILAKKMGLPEIPTFYEQNGTIQGILNGINYGSAEATILSFANIPNFQSLNNQLRQAFETIQLLQLQLGEQEAHQFISSSVFYLSLGKDDYINFLFGNSSGGYNGGDTEWFPKMLVDEMTNALRNLYDAGVRKVVTMGIYPLGCAPRSVVNWYFLTGRNNRRMRVCVNEVNQLVMQHNRLLNDHIIALTMQYSDAQFVFCDVYQGFMHILSNPHQFGFSDARGACCGRGWHGAAAGCDSMEMACNQTNSAHVWWDFYNPSEAVNSLLADSAWSGQPLGEICHPLSIQALANI